MLANYHAIRKPIFGYAYGAVVVRRINNEGH
jgi:hypothetical protein